MSAMEFYNDTCLLCGRSTSNAEPASEQVIDGLATFLTPPLAWQRSGSSKNFMAKLSPPN